MVIKSPESFSLEFTFKLAGRLLLILLVVESVIMVALRASGVSELGEPVPAVVDAALLVACSAPLLYFWVLLPAMREFRKADERMRLLASAMGDAGEAMIIGHHGHGGVVINERRGGNRLQASGPRVRLDR